MSVRLDFLHGDALLHAQLKQLDGDRYQATIGPRTHEVRAACGPDGTIRFTLDGVNHVAESARCGKQLQVRLDSHTWLLEPAQGRARAGGDSAAAKVVEAPMTGTVTKVLVAAGQQVEKGQTLVVLTAMKMEHKLSAGVAGKVAELVAKEGSLAEAGSLLVRLE